MASTAGNNDLGSFEGKYPKDLFRKSVEVNNQAVGYVAKETDDLIVVFSESDRSARFDVPKSEIIVEGGSVVLKEESLSKYRVSRDLPLPQGRGLRPTAAEIRQIAGPGPEAVVRERSEAPSEERSEVESKMIETADMVKDSVGYEVREAGKATKEGLKDLGETAARDAEYAAKTVASGLKDSLRSGARATKKGIEKMQQETEEGLNVENKSKIERQSQQPATELDMASYEGKYPKDLFNKTVVFGDRAVGRVVKESKDTIVVFGQSNSRFDIPKSEIELVGGTISVKEGSRGVSQYKVNRNTPFPEDRPLRASASEIRKAAKEFEEQKKREGEKKEQAMKSARAEAVMRERDYLATRPRPQTTRVSRPEGYTEEEEGQLTRMVRQAAKELKEIIVGGAKVAEMKVKEGRRAAMEKQADLDRRKIAKMGELSARFSEAYEDMISEIRSRPYAEQEQIYSGFIKLVDYQRELLVANRDFATRLKESVPDAVVTKEDQEGTKEGMRKKKTKYIRKSAPAEQHLKSEKVDLVSVDVYSDLSDIDKTKSAAKKPGSTTTTTSKKSTTNANTNTKRHASAA